jgi:alcohol dehydrogenase YqhD (iron-dependent ADH family)
LAGSDANHEVANLLSTDWDDETSDDDWLNEAIANLKAFFTVVGLTEELNTTVQIATAKAGGWV